MAMSLFFQRGTSEYVLKNNDTYMRLRSVFNMNERTTLKSQASAKYMNCQL